jgi:LPS-assembly lipoprotein
MGTSTRSRLVLLCSLLLAGCGFHLRGTMDLPPSLGSIYIQGGNPYGEFVAELRRTLRASHTHVVDSPAGARATLTIQREDVHRQVLSVGSTGKAREYGLALTVEFQVTDPKGQVLVPSQTVSVSRDLSFDSTQVLGKGEEEVLLRQEMIRDAAQQVLWRLRVRG